MFERGKFNWPFTYPADQICIVYTNTVESIIHVVNTTYRQIAGRRVILSGLEP